MSFYSDASLVLIPSGYKDQKVYSAVPTDGSGDLSFSRASSATRVASNGLIEKVRTNLLTYSNTFSNVVWDKSNLTATGGQDDPNGGTSAFLLTSTATAGVYIGQAKVGLGCLSIYAKAGTRSTFSLIPTGYNNGAFFDLSSVTATASGIGSLAKIESVGGGWFRCSVAVSSSTDFIVSLSAINGTGSVIGDTMTFAFAQGETGDIATDYIATTTAAVSVGPVSGLPRLDYLNSTCPRLLLEPQRSNLTQYSEQIDNAYWNKSGGTITANATASPDGYTNADLFTESATTGDHALFDVVNYFVSGTTYTASFFVKANGRTKVTLASANSDTCPRGQFDLVAQTATAVGSSFNAKIENYGNGWFRCSVSRVAPNSGLDLPYYAMNTSFVTNSYAGNGTSGMYFWGMQMEAAAYATSYIPTLGTSVTRVADNATKGSISSLIGQTEGTIFLDFVWGGVPPIVVDNALMSLGYQEYGTSHIAISNYSGALYGRVTVGIASETIAFGAMTIGQRYKAALAYANNDVIFYVNGLSYGTLTSVSIPATSALYFTNDYPNNKGINQALLFQTRLSNSDLASLTSL
jgi:hypothetical protein